jgi:hypothetical protein
MALDLVSATFTPAGSHRRKDLAGGAGGGTQLAGVAGVDDYEKRADRIVMRTVKKRVEYVLRPYPALFRLASRAYHVLNRSSGSLSSGAPEALRKAFETARQRADGDLGDYYEFGVFRGGTLAAAQEVCRDLDIGTTRFFGFDSFKGLPPVEGIDETDGMFFEGQFAAPKEVVERNLSRAGVDWERTTLIEGFFSESLTEETKRSYPFRRASVALIDCDLYSSTTEVLAWLADYLDDGSVLLFDDWETFGDREDLGQKKAFGDFLAAHPGIGAEHLLTFAPHGRGFVLRRAS